MRPLRRLAALALVALAAACTDRRAAAPVADGPTISIEGTAVRYGGKLLPWDVPDARAWGELLGPPSRDDEGILVWDELGAFLHTRRRGGPPSSFVVLLGRTPHSSDTDTEPSYWPRRVFAGRLVVDGAVVHAGSTVDEINRDKRRPYFHRDYLRTISTYDLDGFYVRLNFGHDGTLTSFSISPPDGPVAARDAAAPASRAAPPSAAERARDALEDAASAAGRRLEKALGGDK